MMNASFARRNTLASLAAAAVLSAHAFATNWVVDANNGPGTNFTTINAAIAAAAPGDTIIVRIGSYFETVIVNKAVTIVGWNATAYPMTLPQDAFTHTIWGGLGVINIPAGQKCVVSGLCVARQSMTSGGPSLGVLSCAGTVVLDRIIVPNGSVLITDSDNVFLEDIRVRHVPGALPLDAGVGVFNSRVQANDLDATGGDLAGEAAGFAVAAAPALDVGDHAIVALSRPKLVGGFGGGPWISTSTTPSGGPGIRCIASTIAVQDDVGGYSYIAGGQGGIRGSASLPGLASGNGGNAIEVTANGILANKKPMVPIPGQPGQNNAAGPLGIPGAQAYTATNGVYVPIVDLPAIGREFSASHPGGYFVYEHHAAAPGYPVAVAVMPDMFLAIYAPSLQFQGGSPATAILLGTGTADATGRLIFGFGLPSNMTPYVGVTVAIQSADDVIGTLFLANPTAFTLGF